MTLPFAIAVAPNGARRTTADHPRLPVTPDSIAREAAEALAAGAAMIHMHVRDAAQRHVLDVGLYREATAAVREAVGEALVIQATTEAVGRYTPAEQIEMVDALQPESVSIALREILPEGGDAGAARDFLARTAGAGILLQLIVYDATEVARVEALQQDGILPAGPLALLGVLGRYTQTGGTDAELDAFLAAGIARLPWMLCAFGPNEAHFMARAAGHGAHARVGFENNLWLPDGSMAASNAEIVAATADACRASGRPLATADELRRVWRMAPGAPERTGDARDVSLKRA